MLSLKPLVWLTGKQLKDDNLSICGSQLEA